MRHGAPAGAPQRRHRSRALERLRVGLRHRTHGHAEARRRRPAPLLRTRPALHRAVLMRISFDWLRDLVDVDGVSPEDAAEALTRVGIEVEATTLVDYSEILIGRVISQEPHPRSRNPLWVHEV